MSSKPVLSIVVETGTRQFTGRISFEEMLRRHQSEARRALPDSKFELIFVGSGNVRESLPKNCRYLDRPATSYYGFKSEGARAARGKYLVFWDSDCRAKEGYLELLLKIFMENPKIIGICGMTYYDKPRLVSRLNTLLSWGPYLEGPDRMTDLPVITHNVSIRKAAFPPLPFGPYKARSGGDLFISNYAVKRGQPFLFNKNLVIYHEDMSTHLGATLERRLRDIFSPKIFNQCHSRGGVLTRGFLNCPTLFLKRARRALIYGKNFNVEWWMFPGVMAALLYYSVLETLALLSMAVWPPFLMKWLNFQFGPKWLKTQGIQ